MVSLQLLGALGLLIYGMKIMSDALQKMAGPQLKHIEGNLMQTPEIAVLQAQKETAHFGQRVQEMFGMVNVVQARFGK